MNKTEKIEYLENLKTKIEELNVSDSSIKSLEQILRKEYLRETNDENESRLYSKNLEQTIEKQLNLLLQNFEKGKKRTALFHDTVRNFKMDIDRELGELKYK